MPSVLFLVHANQRSGDSRWESLGLGRSFFVDCARVFFCLHLFGGEATTLVGGYDLYGQPTRCVFLSATGIEATPAPSWETSAQPTMKGNRTREIVEGR